MKRNLGVYFIAGLVALNILLWVFFGPTTGVSKNFPQQVLAETLSSSAMILWACGIFLSNKPRFLEPYFGGLDRMYFIHKNINMLALLVIVVHLIIVPTSDAGGPGVWIAWITFPSILILVLQTISPRVPLISNFIRLTYDKWRSQHKFLGVFYILGATHMLMVQPLIMNAQIVFTYVETIIAIGIAAYLYKEFLRDRLKKRYPYVVQDVKKLNGTVAQVTLRASEGGAGKLNHRAGQFLYVHFDSDRTLQEPHPFTISSAPYEDDLRLSIKSSGDWTQYMHENLKAGARAFVDGPYGEFNYRTGSQKQIWIAGGIGITPFMSWMRDFESNSTPSTRAGGREIDFFYTTAVPEEALFLDEIQKAETHTGFRARISHSSRDGRLSADKVVAASGDPAGKDIYMCGPVPMVEVFRNAFVAKGEPSGKIHYEEFNFR
jgi:predicted ferric reductase